MIQLLRTYRTHRLAPDLSRQREFYSRLWTPAEVAVWQIEQFNERWQCIRRNVPYFATLSRARRLPERFHSWSEFSAVLPVMDRALIQSQRNELRDSTRAQDFFRTTGGSTGEPVQLPAWNSELDFSNHDLWFARSWFGVSPTDKLFLIWGHSHLLGSGWRGQWNRLKREAKDALLGYHRYSAYDLSEPALRRGGEALLKFKPAYVLGYAVALDRFAQVNADRRADFRKLGLKLAVATAESFPRTDSAGVIADVLGCPVAMEYGAVETGVIAHQRPDGIYNVFWRHHFVEGVESKEVPGAREILVTALYPRCFPLVRYRLGDLIVPTIDVADFPCRFATVVGRCNDFIALRDGALIHSEAFTHAIKECPAVLNFQVEQAADGRLRLRFVARDRLGDAEQNEIRRRLCRVNAELHQILLEQVGTLEQSVAGKTRRVIRHQPTGSVVAASAK